MLNDPPNRVEVRLRTFRNRILKASEALAHELLTDIVGRKLSVGDRLPQENEMIARYGVARSTVREALRILEINGLIAIRSGPGGGPTVCNATPADFGRMASFFLQAEQITLGEVLEARRLLEPMLVRNAADKKDPLFLERVADLKRRSSEIDVENDEDYVSVTREFHELVSSIATNRLLTLLSHCLMAMFTLRVNRSIFPPEERASVIGEHDLIMEHILSSRGADAESEMYKHMDRFVQRVKEQQPEVFRQVVSWR